MPSSFDAILREHQSKIWKLASSLTRGYGGTPLQEDLVAAGTVALWRISERYDPLRGTTLWQRAFVRVRGAMIDELRNQSPISRHDREKMKSLGKTSLELVPWGAIRPVSMEAAEHVPSGKNPEEEAVRSGSWNSKIVGCSRVIFLMGSRWRTSGGHSISRKPASASLSTGLMVGWKS